MESLVHYIRQIRQAPPELLFQVVGRMQLMGRVVNVGPKWPMQSRNKETSGHPFFIIGSGRSGNTLLRSILSAHFDVFIPPENGALGRMIRTFSIYRTFPWRVVVATVLEEFSKGYRFDDWKVDLGEIFQKADELGSNRSLADLIEVIYRTYGLKHCPGKNRWGDKTPPNVFALDKINAVFPNARYIHIIRDGRDCVSSFVEAGLHNKSYIQAAYRWRDMVRKCQNFKEKIGDTSRFFELHYEDLVRFPQQTISQICEFLGLEMTEEMYNYAGASEYVQDALTKSHHQNLRKPISTSSIGKWRKNIPSSELPGIMKIIKDDLVRLGYQEICP